MVYLVVVNDLHFRLVQLVQLSCIKYIQIYSNIFYGSRWVNVYVARTKCYKI